MLRRPRMLGGVLVRRTIATKSRATLLTCAQVNPMRPYFYALFTDSPSGVFDF